MADDATLFISIKEAARQLGRSASTVYRMINRGLLQARPCPERPMVLRSSVLDLARDNKTVKTPRKPPARAGARVAAGRKAAKKTKR